MSETPRSRGAQQPPGDLTGFPVHEIHGMWFREHRYRETEDGGCWYFSTNAGRWDLPAPSGTCYFGSSPAVAALERVGHFTARHLPVPEDLVLGRMVSTVDFSAAPVILAALNARRSAARFGVTAELSAIPDYRLTQRWAAALAAHGHRGLLYTPRFSPGENAAALFSEAGPHILAPVVEQRPLAEVLADLGLTVAPTPTLGQLRIADP